MSVKQFKLPDLGEGLTDGDILKWTVAVGDTVEVNDIIAEVETVKAAVELPSPFAGVVIALHADEGETVPVGTPIISIEVGGTEVGGTGVGGTGVGGTEAGGDALPAQAGSAGTAGVEEEKQLTLVGYGPREQTGGRRRKRRPEATAAGAQASFNVPPPTVPHPAPEPAEVEAPAEPTAPRGGREADPKRRRPTANGMLAKPPVRKLAKTLGVDLESLVATGPHGTVSRVDVEEAANGPRVDVEEAANGPRVDVEEAANGPRVDLEEAANGPRVGSYPASGQVQVTTRATSDHSRQTRVPIKGVRKHTAAAMVASAFTAPHVTEFVTVDVTATMELRTRIAERRDFTGVKVSPLLFVAKAVLLAAARTPEINATWDEPAGEIVLKHYVNLGIAAATARGLIVPNIKDAQALTLHELAAAIGDLTDTARAGRTTPEAMSGGTITITNVGVFGVDTGTPILNPGESGILAFGAVRRMPWVVGSGAEERIEPRWVTQLAVSFDHRVVDGQQGSRFLADVAAVLADPGLALL